MLNSLVLNVLKSTWFLVLVCILVATCTHFWNISQFPTFHVDEGHYIRRALHVLNGLGPQENQSDYDHPFMGQIVLASFFKIMGYPEILKPSTSVNSIELLFTIPRLVMGLLFLIDTFLVFMIGRYCYNKNVAFVAGLFFAVTPMTWQLRRVVLESIQLPFVLSSILILTILLKMEFKKNQARIKNFLLLLSGAFLGIAIFTKIPAFTVIPLNIYLIVRFTMLREKNYNHILRNISLWIIPVIVIASIWPAYAITVDDFDEWMKDVMGQTFGRARTLLNLNSFLWIDPLLFFLGVSGLIFTVLKKDFFIILWILPFLLFVTIHGWFLSFHWILLFPAFCISVGVLLIELPKRTFKSINKAKYVYIPIITVIIIFSFVSTLMLASLNISDTQFEPAATAASYVSSLAGNEKNVTKNVLIITSPVFEWLFKYPLHMNNTINYWNLNAGLPTNVSNIILMVDDSFKQDNNPYSDISPVKVLTDNNYNTRIIGNNTGSWIKIDLGNVRTICGIQTSWYTGNSTNYKFSIYSSLDNQSFSHILSNYSNNNPLSEKYVFNNTTARYIVLNLFGSSVNNTVGINELSLSYNAKRFTSDKCLLILPTNITISKNMHIEGSLDRRIELVQNLLSQSRVVSIISSEEKNYPSYFSYASIRYSSPERIVEIREIKEP